MALITSRPQSKTTVDGLPLAYQLFTEGNYVPLVVEVERTTITDDLTNSVVVFSASGGKGSEYYISKSSEYPSQVSLISITSDRIKALVKLVKEDTLFFLDNVTNFQYSVGLRTDLGLMELERGFFNVNPSIALGKLSQAPVPDAPPLVTLIAPSSGQKLFVNKPLKLLAQASDIGGAIEKVEFYANEIKVGTNNSYSQKGVWDFRYNPTQAGSVTFYSIAYDSSGYSSKSNAVAVDVDPEPIIPTVNFGFTPLTGAAPLSVTFINTSVNAASYEWDFGDATAVSSAIAPTHIYQASGNYTVKLTATNLYGSVSLTKSITVNVATNQPPTVSITNPAQGTSVVVGQQLALTASAADGDGSVAGVQIKVNGVNQGSLLTSSPYTTNFTPNQAGTYSITAVVTDNLGLTTTSAAVTLTVTAPTVPTPTVSLTAPKAGLVNEAQTIAIAASVTGGTIDSVQLQVNAVNVGTPDTSTPYSISWTPVAKGVYAVRAVANASGGGMTTSTAVNVSIYDTKITTEGAGTSLAANAGDYVLLDNNQAAGGLPASADLFVGTEQVGVFNYSADAYNGKPFAFFRSSNSTMYTGTVASGTVTLNG